MCLLYFSGIIWTIIYYTIYVHQDKTISTLICLKFMALLFRENTKQCLSGFVVTMLGVLNLMVAKSGHITPYYNSVAVIGNYLVHQTYILDIHRPEDC